MVLFRNVRLLHISDYSQIMFSLIVIICNFVFFNFFQRVFTLLIFTSHVYVCIGVSNYKAAFDFIEDRDTSKFREIGKRYFILKYTYATPSHSNPRYPNYVLSVADI